MNSKLIIVTNCSDRKRQRREAVHPCDAPSSIQVKVESWCRQLEAPDLPRFPAMDLYQGDHWSSVLTLVRKAERVGWETDLWVASAGYGLTPSHACLSPYAATFAGGHPDSVGAMTGLTPKVAAKEWWRHLGEWQGPVPGAPRSLAALAKANPDSAWLFLMSPTYMNAISDDLMGAVGNMLDPDRMVLVSGTPGPGNPNLIPHWVPTLEICRGTLGGSCNSLNARLGAHLVQWFPPFRWFASQIQPEANLWMAGLSPLDRPMRRAISDEEALQFIRRSLTNNPGASHSTLLRELRSSGVACEQKRFRNLYKSQQASS